jgi:hypothetical protein
MTALYGSQHPKTDLYGLKQVVPLHTGNQGYIVLCTYKHIPTLPFALGVQLIVDRQDLTMCKYETGSFRYQYEVY